MLFLHTADNWLRQTIETVTQMIVLFLAL